MINDTLALLMTVQDEVSEEDKVDGIPVGRAWRKLFRAKWQQ
jgi:hypothetical protein